MGKCYRPYFPMFVPFSSVRPPSAELMAPVLHLLFSADRELGQQMKLLGNFERIALCVNKFVSCLLSTH